MYRTTICQKNVLQVKHGSKHRSKTGTGDQVFFVMVPLADQLIVLDLSLLSSRHGEKGVGGSINVGTHGVTHPIARIMYEEGKA